MRKCQKVTLTCANGHQQEIKLLDMGPDEAHDFGVLLAGGILRSITRPMPGYPCKWPVDSILFPSNPPKECGAKVSFTVAEIELL